jgi:hypothetical protein
LDFTVFQKTSSRLESSRLARSTRSHCHAARMVVVHGDADFGVDDGRKGIDTNVDAGIEEFDIARIEKIYK